MWFQPSLPFLEFVGRSEVMRCIAPFAYALKHLYEALVYISLPEVTLSLYDTSFYQIINLMFYQTMI